MTDRRPDPDALLRRVSAQEDQNRKGRLKVFFGASPGVGKTYAMLEAAQRKKAEGVDVVVGWVETHGRPETAALLEGLERIPPHELEYRGTRLEEFDLSAALARRPAVLLLDEQAHTNVPGSTHAKRWQDVQELLDAGIDVWSTLNVQHLESLNDLVNQITGVVVRETVPDHVIDAANELEFIDLPPDALLERLALGKVYVPEQAARAVQSFFRRGNLLALRELALRRTAERVDADVRVYRRDHEIEQTWPVAERMLVCIRPHAGSGRLVRAARRMAARLRAEWIVASVESSSQRPPSEQEREALVRTMNLAEQLGARTAVLTGDDVSEALVRYAREHNVSRIVVGKPAHGRWRDRIKGSLADEIVRRSGEIDVYFISGEGEEASPAPVLQPRSPVSAYLPAVVIVVLATGICWAMFGRFDRSNLIMVYLLGMSFVAVRYGRGPSVLAAVLSVAAFDFFYVPPYLTFAVSDTQYLVTFVVMLLVGLLISTLAVRVRDQMEAAHHRERRTETLYSVSRELAALRGPADVAEVACRHAAELFRGSAVAFLPKGADRLEVSCTSGSSLAVDPPQIAVAEWAFQHGRSAGLGTDTLPGAALLCLPLKSGERTLGVLGIAPHETLRPLSPDQVDLLETLAQQTASALERARLAAEGEEGRVAMERERLRSALLSSVSHDLRTPLGVIEGAASTLLDEQAALDPPTRRDLVQTIHEEAERLHDRVRELLDMTRLESGNVELQVEWQSLEEVVGAALRRLERALGQRRVDVDLPPSLPLVPCDAVLMEQVLVNLLENALKYSPAEQAIEIGARAAPGEVVLSVADRGPGIPPGDEERIFEKFYRPPRDRRGGGGGGVGLGLAICRAIVDAHRGRIWAENRSGGGAVFHVALPNPEPPPPPVEPPERARAPEPATS